MPRKPLTNLALLACAVLVLAGITASADDKKDSKDKPAPSGVWVRKEGELQIDFSNKDAVTIRPHGNNVLVIRCKCTAEKEGRVKVEITDVEGDKEEAVKKVKEHLPAGTKFNFRWKVKDGTARLDDLKGEDHVKSHLEGEYEPKK